MWVTVLAVLIAKAIMLALYMNARRWRKLYAIAAAGWSQETLNLQEEKECSAAWHAVARDRAERLAEISAIVRRVPRRRWIAEARRIARASCLIDVTDVPDYAHPR